MRFKNIILGTSILLFFIVNIFITILIKNSFNLIKTSFIERYIAVIIGELFFGVFIIYVIFKLIKKWI